MCPRHLERGAYGDFANLEMIACSDNAKWQGKIQPVIKSDRK